MKQGRTFDDFYKAVTKYIDEENEATEKEKGVILDGLDKIRPLMELLDKQADELGLTDEEGYICAYLAEHGEGHKQASPSELAVLQLVTMMFVHDHNGACGPFAKAASTR